MAIDINYNAIKAEIASIIDLAATGAIVQVEGDLTIDSGTTIIDVAMRRRTQHADQSLSYATRQRYLLEMEITIWAAAVEGSLATQMRDRIIEQVEGALMANRTINGMAETMILKGGDMLLGESEKMSGLYVAAGQVLADVDVVKIIDPV